jgi:hypothetical protein
MSFHYFLSRLGLLKQREFKIVYVSKTGQVTNFYRLDRLFMMPCAISLKENHMIKRMLFFHRMI